MEELGRLEERVILIGVQTAAEDNVLDSLDELEELAETAGAVTVGRIIQNREAVHPGTYIGKGKIEEVRSLVYAMDATGVICDDELSPAQLNNLERELDCKVMDRTLLILDIFAARAVTSEGKIQVELAQLRYRSARLVGLRESLSRLGGGIGTRGPGEKKLETDRRLIRTRISALKQDLAQVEKHRELLRTGRARGKVKTAAIVGYTNAGKSSLLSLVSGSEVMARDMLFATLDTTTRKIELPHGQPLLLTDTVGFIRNLPHRLVEAFKSTLEEAVLADFLIQVVDASDPEAVRHYETTLEVLNELGAGDKPMIVVLNKVDLVPEERRGALETLLAPHFSGRVVPMSVKEGNGEGDLLNACVEMLESRVRRARFLIPYTRSDLVAAMHSEGKVFSTEYVEEGTLLEAVLPVAFYNKLESFLADR